MCVREKYFRPLISNFEKPAHEGREAGLGLDFDLPFLISKQIKFFPQFNNW